MKSLMMRIAPLSTMLIFPVLGMIYALVNGPHGEVYNIATRLDEITPFVKVFVLPYSVWIFYIYACLVYFYFKEPAVYYRGLLIYSVCALVCYGIYLSFQTTVTRPIVIGDDFPSKLLSFVYSRDEPYNCFPSIHCFSSFMVMKLLYKSGFRNRWNQTLIYGMSTAIIFSTLFIKQHVIYDAIAGIALVEVVHWIVVRIQQAASPSYASKALSRKA